VKYLGVRVFIYVGVHAKSTNTCYLKQLLPLALTIKGGY
jgi:hypothetical protein